MYISEVEVIDDCVIWWVVERTNVENSHFIEKVTIELYSTLFLKILYFHVLNKDTSPTETGCQSDPSFFVNF